jgi:Na+/H+ antiporter NhaC
MFFLLSVYTAFCICERGASFLVTGPLTKPHLLQLSIQSMKNDGGGTCSKTFPSKFVQTQISCIRDFAKYCCVEYVTVPH